MKDPTLVGILSRFPGRRILVVGDVMLDEYLWGSVHRTSPEAPVPVVELQRRSHAPGGAANAAANVVGLRGEALLAGVVGDDERGRQLLDALRAGGVCADGVVVDGMRPTTTKTRIVAQGQQVVRVDDETRAPVPDSAERSLLRFLEDRMASADACVVSDYAKGVVSPALARRFIQAAREQGKPVVVDPKGADFSKYRGATVVKPNLSEAVRSLGREGEAPEDALAVGRRLLDALQPARVLLTRGAEGMTLFEAGAEPMHIPAEVREVYDVTGAGDTVTATLAVALAAGADPLSAARLANRAAAIAVGRMGTAAILLDELVDAQGG